MTTKIGLLVGRDGALRELRTALVRTADGAGGCVVVEGPAGIGKSHLLEALAAEASRLDVAVASSRAAELDRVTPFATLLRVLRSHVPRLGVGILEDSESSALWRVDQLRAAMEHQVRDRPLLVLLDDARLADELTALALRVLVPALASSPVLWVLARRPGPVRGVAQTAQEAIDWLIGEGARRVRLDPLDDEAVAELCAHTLDATPDRTVLKLAARCGGNPFLLCELLTALRQAGQLRVDDGQATVVGTGLPADFLSAVHGRLSDLSERVRRLVDAGAVLARPFTLHEAAGLLGCSAVSLVPAATDAVTSGALVDHGDELAFRHELVREVVYGALSGPVRSALHREAATVLQEEGRSAVEAAEHLVLCGRPGTERAKEVLTKAVAQVTPTAPGTAADLTLQMLELFDETDAGRPRLVADAVRLLAAAGRVEQAVELGEQVLRSGLDAPSEAALLIGLSEALKHAGRNSAVIDYTDRGLSREGVSEMARAQLQAIRAHALLAAPDLSAAQHAGAEAAKLGARTGQHAATVFGMVACSVTAQADGSLDEAVRRAREAVRTADLAGGEASQRHPRLWLGRALAAADQFAEADAVFELGQREANQLGTAWSQPLWHYYRAELRMAAGRLDDANAEAEAGIRVCEQFAVRALTVPLLGLLGQVSIHQAELSKAREHLHRGQALLAGGLGAGPEDLAWRMALLAEARGQPEAAMEALTEIYDGFPHRLLLLTQDSLAGVQLVRIAQRAGAEAQAKAAASATRLLAERNPTVLSLAGAAAHAEGLLHGDLVTLRYAVQAYRSSPRVLAKASALEDTARAERKAGQRSAAVELLRAALGHYQSCGAQRDATRVARRLNRLGARRALTADAPVSGPWDTLTESELRVVRLVARGLTNRETASRLFLSPHTVDSHLRHSFTKLGVNSRVELTRQVLVHDRND
ncbi:MAG TPA: AAA family ATPase [Pseudonocardiaceae bacterium]|nr:AAA family ATPase [Pseudonocardiaceae bacterium]